MFYQPMLSQVYIDAKVLRPPIDLQHVSTEVLFDVYRLDPWTERILAFSGHRFLFSAWILHVTENNIVAFLSPLILRSFCLHINITLQCNSI